MTELKQSTIVMLEPLSRVEQIKLELRALQLKPPVMLRFLTPEQYIWEMKAKRRVN